MGTRLLSLIQEYATGLAAVTYANTGLSKQLSEFQARSAFTGVGSPVSDSQSITSGDKLSLEEIRQREKGKAEQSLDKFLSKEASRLNYPFKINTLIETEYLEEGLKKVFRERHGSLLITSPDVTCNPVSMKTDELK